MTGNGSTWTRTLLCLSLAWCFIGTTPPAQAQSRSTRKGSVLTANPAQHKRQGDKWFKQRRFADALVEYTLAHSVSPAPIRLFDIARTLEALGHTDAAIRLYQFFLAQVDLRNQSYEAKQRIARLQRGPEIIRNPPPPPPPPPVKRTIRTPPPPPPPPPPPKPIVPASNQGKLALVIMPPGAAIRIDGQFAGKSPLRAPISLIEGMHRLEVSLAGYNTETRSFRIARSARTPLTIMMRPAAGGNTTGDAVGTLIIRSVPPGATVFISGRTAPVSKGTVRVRVAPGTHVVEVKHPGYRGFKKRVKVSPGQNVTVRATMTRR